jgi:hypothetical protein
MKKWMKSEFLTEDVVIEETGEIKGHIVKDTRDLSKTEMSVFWDRIIQYAVEEFQIQLPYPNEQFEIQEP